MCYAGKVIKAGREKRKMSQRDLGKVLGHTTGQFVHHLEIGKAVMPAKLVPQICQVLKIPQSKLIAAALKDHQRAFEKSIQKWKDEAEKT